MPTIDETLIHPLPPVSVATLTRTATGVRRSEAVGKTGHHDTVPEVVSRFAAFEQSVEALEADLRLPDRYRAIEVDRLRAALDVDLHVLESAALSDEYKALDKEEAAVLSELKLSHGSKLFTADDTAFIDKTSDPQALVDFAEELLAIDAVGGIRRTLPMIADRLTDLATLKPQDEQRHAMAKHVRILLSEWQQAHPTGASRRRDIRARRARAERDVRDRFGNTRTRLGLKAF